MARGRPEGRVVSAAWHAALPSPGRPATTSAKALGAAAAGRSRGDSENALPNADGAAVSACLTDDGQPPTSGAKAATAMTVRSMAGSRFGDVAWAASGRRRPSTALTHTVYLT